MLWNANSSISSISVIFTHTWHFWLGETSLMTICIHSRWNCFEIETLTSASASHLVVPPRAVIMSYHFKEEPVVSIWQLIRTGLFVIYMEGHIRQGSYKTTFFTFTRIIDYIWCDCSCFRWNWYGIKFLFWFIFGHLLTWQNTSKHCWLNIRVNFI